MTEPAVASSDASNIAIDIACADAIPRHLFILCLFARLYGLFACLCVCLFA